VTTLYLIGGGVLVILAALWLGMRTARRQGAAEAREEEARHVVENAERITAAVEAAPRDAGSLVERVSKQGHI